MEVNSKKTIDANLQKSSAYDALVEEKESIEKAIAEEWVKLEKQTRRKDRSTKSAMQIISTIQHYRSYRQGLIVAIVQLNMGKDNA